MTKKGFKSITIPESLYSVIFNESQKQGISISKYLEEELNNSPMADNREVLRSNRSGPMPILEKAGKDQYFEIISEVTIKYGLLQCSTMIPNANLKLLKEKAKELGANEAIIIPAKSIVVENRTILKCIFGCNGWGSRVCPPFIPTVEDFRKMLAEYQWALLVDWKSENVLSREISENFVKYGVSLPRNNELKEEYQQALKTVIRERKERIQPGSLELEKLAWALGYNTALATFPGMCTWCANSDYSEVNCASFKGECHHTTIRRPCMMGLGIRLDKTLEKLDIPLPNFPLENSIPKQYTLIFID